MNREGSAPSIRVLLSWYDGHRRVLPWREEPTPYHVWLSEIMLQQTRVEAARGYYERFLAALPDIRALAEAPEEQYMKLWEGLGYYSRVRNLHRAAVQIMEEYGGEMPADAAELKKLAGIGRYTAAAVSAIAFGRRAAAVDGNLQRIFTRLTGYRQNIKSAAALSAAEIFWTARMDEGAEEFRNADGSPLEAPGSPRNYYGDCNQALMDLGAAVCLPNGGPHCDECPWEHACVAHAEHCESRLPVLPKKRLRRVEERTVLVIRDAERTALRKRPAKGLLAGLYELPNTEGCLNEAEALEYVRSLGLSPLHIRGIGPAKHVFSHVEWHMTGYEVRVDELEERAAPGLLLVETAEALTRYSIPSAFAAYAEYAGIRGSRPAGKKKAPGDTPAGLH
ncbi:A/G-specific adenine glycosylase [Lachnoclostridium sp. Marseille-P6806]|uniref:A/G-specific adenine glycosylase n=1 Tax=Lachnoclostridium sp. Marseille-P6806 TaxID=2364793 RepID=UPI001F5F1628|nr:A/G-specific adenine glycosylase [Lachnoclostridium sp. Marseille-P6806]